MEAYGGSKTDELRESSELARFVPWLLLALIAALVLSVLLYLAFLGGFYFVLVVPIVAAVALGLVVVAIIQASRAHYKAVGALFGILAGAVMYLGYYHAGVVHALGIEGIHRVDLLPDYIAYRMSTDVIADPVTNPARDDEYHPPDNVGQGVNWTTFAFEAGFCVLIPGFFGVARASRPYCLHCRTWMKQLIATFPPDMGIMAVGALERGQLAELATWPKVASNPRQPNTTIAVEYCKPDAATAAGDCPVYFSVKSCKSGALTQFGRFDSAIGKLLVRRKELNPDEVAALVPLFPSLADLHDWAPSAGDRPASESAAAPVSVQIESIGPAIEHVQLAEVGQGAVLNRRTLIKATLLHLSPVGVVLIFLTLLIGGIALVGYGADGPDVWGTTNGKRWAILIAGGIGTVAALVWALTGGRRLSARFAYRKTRDMVQQRHDRWVDADDPDAVFAEIVPRKNWSKLMHKAAVDVGFVKPDMQRSRILFEGDCNRYAIPAEAVQLCRVEQLYDFQGNRGLTAVVVNALSGNLPMELPFIAYRPPWSSSRRASARTAAVLQRAMTQMLELATASIAVDDAVPPEFTDDRSSPAER